MLLCCARCCSKIWSVFVYPVFVLWLPWSEGIWGHGHQASGNGDPFFFFFSPSLAPHDVPFTVILVFLDNWWRRTSLTVLITHKVTPFMLSGTSTFSVCYTAWPWRTWPFCLSYEGCTFRLFFSQLVLLAPLLWKVTNCYSWFLEAWLSFTRLFTFRWLKRRGIMEPPRASQVWVLVSQFQQWFI